MLKLVNRVLSNDIVKVVLFLNTSRRSVLTMESKKLLLLVKKLQLISSILVEMVIMNKFVIPFSKTHKLSS